MTNKQIAQVLGNIAKILEIKGGDRFRIMAYERASHSIESHGEEMHNVYERGGVKALNDIEGVGESIAEKIEEMLKTGKCKSYEDLQKGVPPAEVEFMKIPGVGPKTAVELAKKLKARDIKDLEKKLKEPQAQKHFKEKTRENIVRGVGILKSFEGRLILTEAMPVAEKFTAALQEMREVKKVDAVGSLRRWQETVGDIDIVAAADNPQKVIGEFVKFPGVKEILGQGETKATIIHSSGVQIDLEILPENKYGSLLQHFTGSKDHNIALRTYAVRHGKSVSEHGVKVGKKLVKCPEEKDVYGMLKMDYIPPELRENRGEIEAALAHQLPQLITIDDIKGDLHIHSNWSDGTMKIAEVAERCEKLSYQYLAISDHTVGLGVASGLDSSEFDRRQKEIDVCQREAKIKIFSSCEVNIMAAGKLDLPDAEMRKFEIVTASIHSAFQQSKDKITSRILAAIRHPNVNIIGHPTGRILNRRPSYEADWQEIFKVAAAEKVALEISAFPDRLDLQDTLVQEAKKFGCLFAINTDAHSLEHLILMRFGVSVARRGWLEKERVINTWSLEKINRWLNK